MPDSQPLWQRRFRAPIVGFPTWAPGAPDRLVFASSESGVYQLHAWDRATGERRQITNEPVGLIGGEITPDGEWVVWHRDTTGDESGMWVAAPFSGGAAEPFIEGLPEGWDAGMAIGRTRTAAAINDRDGFSVWAADNGRAARKLAFSEESIELGGMNALMAGPEQGGLSPDERLLCIEHSEHGDMIHPSLRILDALTGAVVGDLRDEGLALCSFAWSPIPGDPRLAIGHERRGERRPAIWNVETGELTELEIPWDRFTEVADWWPDASALLLFELRDGRHYLHRYDLATGTVTPLPMREGSLTGARVRPDGSVWYRLQSGTTPGIVYETGRDAPILEAPGEAPHGRAYTMWEYRNPNGQRVHGWLVKPDGPPPWPTYFWIHGGPTSVDLDRWQPDVQAYVDMGFCVAMLNYRGSIGFGAAWRDALIGNIGWPEVEDIVAGLDDLVARGIADPERTAVGGWSWGGYLTLLTQGMHPGRFTAGVAGVPVADYVSAYEAESPLLQAYDRALLGGEPHEVPQLMKERSPIEYVDRVSAPLLILGAEHDSRCPLPQILTYVDRLRARRHPCELYLFGTGHNSFEIDERVRQVAKMAGFLASTVDGVTRLEDMPPFEPFEPFEPQSGSLAPAGSSVEPSAIPSA